MRTAYDRFTPLSTFQYPESPAQGPVSVYVKGLVYTIRTTELRKRVAQWEEEGKVRIIPPSNYEAYQAAARGTMETSDGPHPHHRRSRRSR